MSSVKAAKAALRKEMKEKLLSLSKEAKERQSKKVHEKLFSLPVFAKSQRISVYLSTDLEISTEEVVKKIFAERKQCFVPRYTERGMEMVKLHSVADWANLPLTKWNIKQPDLREKRENASETGGLDLIITPGVAFTTSGHRIGHGKGYYDAYFTSLPTEQRKKTATVALAFAEQVVATLPVTEHDVTLDAVLYPD